MMRGVRDALGRRWDRGMERRREAGEHLDERGVRLAEALYRRADALVARAFREERCALPGAAGSGGASGVVDDLVAYTQLPRAIVERMLVEREPTSFRSEWHATPPDLRADHWFYLSGSAYLFGNAIHFADDEAVGIVDGVLPRQARVLDFGAGVGNFALGLARHGHRVVADELSAIQRDFLRFRIHRHGLSDQLSVIDPWVAPEPGGADAVTAFDVFEHLPDGEALLRDRILPALSPDGVLIEDSPFVQNTANPMHHADWGLTRALEDAGFRVRSRHRNLRVWERTDRPVP
jgi:SAM-dependent methyltransferase